MCDEATGIQQNTIIALFRFRCVLRCVASLYEIKDTLITASMGNEVSAQIGPEDTKKRVVIDSKNITQQAVHQFTWYYPNWEPQLDENGQTYYQNALSLETRWDPRELEDICEDEQNDYYNEEQTWDAPHMDDTGTDVSSEMRQGSVLRTASSMALVQKQKAIQIEERREKVKDDPIAPWSDLSEKAKINMDTLQEHVSEAQVTLSTSVDRLTVITHLLP